MLRLEESYLTCDVIVYEMCHKLPFPLSPRTFPVLVVTARIGVTSFIVVQIPVKLDTFHKAFYSNGRNLKSGDNAAKRKSQILGYLELPFTFLECPFNKSKD